MRLSLLTVFLFLLGCGNPAETSQKNLSSSLSNFESCPVGAYDPENAEELRAMLNALPTPFDSDCILKALKRPLYVNASSSTMSVQPAKGAENPRIFIFKNKLIIAIVPAGEGSTVLEFSELKNDVRSIKGEIALPVTKKIEAAAPFVRINANGKTTCQGCHASEQEEYMISSVPVYSSRTIKPSANKDVPLSTLQDEFYLCNFRKDESKRCRIYRGLFYGKVESKEFPEDMPTLLDMF